MGPAIDRISKALISQPRPSCIVKLSDEFDHLAREAVREEMNIDGSGMLKDYYQRCFDQALIDGVEPTQISRTVLERLNRHKETLVRAERPDAAPSECVINARWYYKVAAAAGYTDPEYNRIGGELGESAHQGNTSTEGYQRIGKHTVENHDIISAIDRYITHLKTMRGHLHDRMFASVMPGTVVEDILLRITAWCDNCEDYFNLKQVMPVNSQVIFLDMYNVASGINDAFGLYFDEVRRIHIEDRSRTKKSNSILTAKELKKIINRDVMRLSTILEPKSANDARLNGFYGQECSQCGSYRTRVDSEDGMVACSKCHHKMERASYLVCRVCQYFQSTEKLVDGKCPTPGCGNDIMVPI